MDDSSGGDHANLERDRRLWGGVALLPRIAQTIQTALRGLEISNDIYTGYPTIHFTDLANGEGRYWDLKGKARIAPIELFGDLFTRFNLPVLIVQVAPSTVEQLIANGHEFVQLPGIDTTRPDDLALMTCYRVLHGGSFDAVGYHGELSIVADRWNGRENSVQPLYKDEVGVPFGTPVIDGLFPRGIAFMSVENFPLLQLADFAAWGYSRLELMHARGVDEMNEYQREVFDILTQVSRSWRTFRLNPDGSTKVLTLPEIGL